MATSNDFISALKRLAGSASSRSILPGSARADDQQHHALVRVLLQRGRQQRGADDPLLLLVGGDDRGQRRLPRVEVLVKAGPAGPVMGARAVEEPEPGQQVRERGHRQQRDDEQVQDLLGPRDRVLRPRVEEVVEEPDAQVGQPREHRDDDGEPPHRDPRVADRLGNHRQGLGAPIPAPLLAPFSRLLALPRPVLGRLGRLRRPGWREHAAVVGRGVPVQVGSCQVAPGERLRLGAA
jgi:hypothetical protein